MISYLRLLSHVGFFLFFDPFGRPAFFFSGVGDDDASTASVAIDDPMDPCATLLELHSLDRAHVVV